MSKEKHKNDCKKWREANKEKCKAYRRAHYLKNKAKVQAINKKYQIQNAETVGLYKKEWRRINSDKVKAKAKNWAELHPEKAKGHRETYRIKNPGQVNAITAKRRAAKLLATPKWLTEDQFKEICEYYILAKELQWLSDPTDPLEVDHIVPLRGKKVSGLHVPWNLQILPKSLNCSKNNKL